MTTTHETLASRAKAWLGSPRSLQEIQDAHSKLLKKIERETSVDPADGRAALGELVEGYVDAGGDMFDLFPDQAPLTPPIQGSQVHPAQFDLSPLSPDVMPRPPLTHEQKVKAIQDIRALLNSPKQVAV
ncbi:TPA: hypothetical protein ACP32N_003143 [Pseudomonas aeruginosa]